jgi:hypothetical protein
MVAAITAAAIDVRYRGKADIAIVRFNARLMTGMDIDASQESDLSGLLGGPLLCGFLFCERVSRQKLDADLITGNTH